MNKQKKQFIFVIIILILGIAAYFGVHAYNKNQEEKKQAEEEASVIDVASINSDDVTELSYTLDGTELSFIKDGEAWNYSGDGSIDIEESGITSMLSALSGMTAEDVIGAGEYESLADYGLEDPSITVTVKTEEATAVFYQGDYNEMLKQYYLKTDGDDRIFLMETSLSSAFNKTVEDLTVEEETESSKEE